MRLLGVFASGAKKLATFDSHAAIDVFSTLPPSHVTSKFYSITSPTEGALHSPRPTTSFVHIGGVDGDASFSCSFVLVSNFFLSFQSELLSFFSLSSSCLLKTHIAATNVLGALTHWPSVLSAR